MSSFEVTPSDLQSLASHISSLLGEIMQAASRVSAAAPGAAQNGDLEAAIEGFLGDWSSGLHELNGKLEAVASKLSGAAGAYEHAEGNIASHFGPG